MIVLFTDFGTAGPYTGQVKSVLHLHAPDQYVIDLFSDLSAYSIKPAAYLIDAYSQHFANDTVFLTVVDPGVGSHERLAVVLRANNQWFVGPDNGLLSIIARHASEQVSWYDIIWQPEQLSSTFHGRDLFAPVAAALACGDTSGLKLKSAPNIPAIEWEDDFLAIVYIDVYGNLITGTRAVAADPSVKLMLNGKCISAAKIFSDVPKGTAFWYINANGLVEIAVNQGRADKHFNASVCDILSWVSTS